VSTAGQLQIVFCGTGWLPIVEKIRARLPPGAAIRLRDPGRPVAEEVRDAEVIVPSNATVDAAVIAAARKLRLIQQSAAGYEMIDLAAARARGVPVCNAPGANAEAMAQAALYLMLALTRRVKGAAQSFARGLIGVPLGVELGGKVLGIVGLGRSGGALARAAAALGMEIVAVRSGSTPADFDALLRRADFVSLHCPLTDATRDLFDDAAFARMKPGTILINCARAAVVSRDAIERALASGRLGGAGLVTHWQEPWEPADPLYARDDVVALPHIAGSTEESFDRLADIVAGNVARLLRGEEPLHRVA